MATLELERLAKALCAESGEPESCAKFYRNATRAILTELIAIAGGTPGMVEAVAFSIIEGSAGTRAAEHAKEFCTANWEDALRSARAAIPAMIRHVLGD